MPELPEVHRATHFLRLYLLNTPHTLSRVTYYVPPDNKNPATQNNDAKIFDTAKTGVDAASFSKSLQGKKIKNVGRLGKYFWLEMESSPHPLFHFGMTGWIKYKGGKGEGVDYWEGKVEGRNGEGANKKEAKGKKGKKQDTHTDTELPNGEGESTDHPPEVPEGEWPPRFTKVLFEATSASGETTDFAFVDGRRFSKLQLVRPESNKDIRETEPLASNGPDPVLEADKVTSEWLGETLGKRKVPIKALLLDQHALSGVGNWVADEVLFHARIHPEKLANSLNEGEVKRLAEQLKSVCKIAALDALGDSHKFPDDWLMRHRWRLDKTGNAGVLPSGEKIVRITVGGRSSAVVPSRQGRGPNSVAKQDEDADIKTSSSKKRKAKTEEDEHEENGDEGDAEVAQDGEEAISASKGSRSPRRSSGRNAQSKPRAEAVTPAKKQKSSKSVSDGSNAGKRSVRGSKR